MEALPTPGGTVVARASALFLRRGEQPPDEIWTTPVTMPPLPPMPGPDFGLAALTHYSHARVATRVVGESGVTTTLPDVRPRCSFPVIFPPVRKVQRRGAFLWYQPMYCAVLPPTGIAGMPSLR